MSFEHRVARVVGLGLCTDRTAGFTTQPVHELELDLNGIIGDARYGQMRPTGPREREWGYADGIEALNYRSITLTDEAELEKIAASLGVKEVTGYMLGANVMLEGCEKLSLMRSSILRFASGAALMLTMQNGPCKKPGDVIRDHYQKPPGFELKFKPAALNRRGQLAMVYKPGFIRLGTLVDIYERVIEDVNLG